MEVTSATSAAASAPASASAATKLGKDDFLKLLIAQLQNQDPLNPSDPAEFMSQLAQLESLEQTQNMSSALESLAGSTSMLGATNLLGKQVTFLDATSKTAQAGTVDSLQMSDGVVYLGINGRSVTLADLLTVGS